LLTDSQKGTDIWFFLLFIPVAYASYLFHELGHWSVGEVLGNRMAYSLNYVWPKSGHYLREGQDLYVLIGGPAFSVLQAIVALLIIEVTRALYAYPFAFFPMFNRAFSLLLGGFSKQDEARIAVLTNTASYVVAVLVLVILFSIVIRCSFKLGIKLQTNAYILTASTACQVLVIGTYEFLKV
jgi:hypothetical protein